MHKLAKKILKEIPGTKLIEVDEYETDLQVPGIPGYVRVTETGFTMTHNNIIPSSVALRVLNAIKNK